MRVSDRVESPSLCGHGSITVVSTSQFDGEIQLIPSRVSSRQHRTTNVVVVSVAVEVDVAVVDDTVLVDTVDVERVEEVSLCVVVDRVVVDTVVVVTVDVDTVEDETVVVDRVVVVLVVVETTPSVVCSVVSFVDNIVLFFVGDTVASVGSAVDSVDDISAAVAPVVLPAAVIGLVPMSAVPACKWEHKRVR